MPPDLILGQWHLHPHLGLIQPHDCVVVAAEPLCPFCHPEVTEILGLPTCFPVTSKREAQLLSFWEKNTFWRLFVPVVALSKTLPLLPWYLEYLGTVLDHPSRLAVLKDVFARCRLLPSLTGPDFGESHRVRNTNRLYIFQPVLNRQMTRSVKLQVDEPNSLCLTISLVYCMRLTSFPNSG